MCDPVTLASAAVGIGGGLVNAYEQNSSLSSAINARNAATTKELDRQKVYREQSQGEFSDTLDDFSADAQEKKLADTKQSVSDAFLENAPSKESTTGFSTSNAPKVVKQSENKKLADVFQFGKDQTTALGNVAGWDQRYFDNSLNLNQSGRNLDITSDLARTSATVGGLEQDAAYKNALKPKSGLGDIMSFAGQVGAYGGQKGWFGGTGGTSLVPAAKPATSYAATAPSYLNYNSIRPYG